MKKRMVALVLCFIMCFSFFPAQSFGEETAELDGDTVYVEAQSSLADEPAPPTETEEAEDADNIVLPEELPADPSGETSSEGDSELYTEPDAETETNSENDSSDPSDPVIADAGAEKDGQDQAANPAAGTENPANGDLSAEISDGSDHDGTLTENQAEPTETAAPASAAAEEPDEQEEVFFDIEVEAEVFTLSSDTDNEELLNVLAEQALQNAIPGRRKLRAQKNVGGRLTGIQQILYQAVRTYIGETAAGTRTSTKYSVDVTNQNLEWLAADLGYQEIDTSDPSEAIRKAAEKSGINLSELLSALLADCPYELYWFDKTGGVSANYSCSVSNKRVIIKGVNYNFKVASDYSAGYYTLNTSYIDSINSAINRAKSIVSSATALSDREKLSSYRRQICSLTSYNNSAASGSTAYGNPWQLIWVFDGKDNTNVVCEGYAKAFQYLCDLTSFNTGTITCYTVTGDLTTSLSGAEGHMWNIVTMDDGKNYLVDVTNCDSGAIGDPEGLFLQGYDSGSLSAGYTINCNYGNTATYVYDSETRATYNSSDLTLAEQDYAYTPHVHTEGEPQRENVIAASYTAAGSYDEVIYCTTCGIELSRTNKTIEKLQLSTPVLTSISSSAATVTLKWNAVSGVQEYRVFRKTGSDGWRKLTDTTGLSYTDKAVTTGTTYTYTVRCVSNDGSYYMSSYDSKGLSVKAAFKLATPVMTSVLNTTSGVQLKWNSVSGAAKYRVFRKIPGGSWSILGDVTATSFTDKSAKIGTTYTYTVRCISNDRKSYMSDYDSAGMTIRADYALPKPTLTAAVSSGGKVTVKWNTVTGATKYRVFRKKPGGSWQKLADVNGTSYTDSKASYGTTYIYTVRCISSDGKSYTSSYDFVGRTVTVSWPNAAPTLSSISSSKNRVTLKWNRVSGAAKYRVFRKVSGGGWQKMADVSGTSYTDKTAKSGTTYTYTVRCISSDAKTYTSLYNTSGLSITCK